MVYKQHQIKKKKQWKVNENDNAEKINDAKHIHDSERTDNSVI